VRPTPRTARTIPGAGIFLALVLLAGCFASPDFARVPCKAEGECPSGFICDLGTNRCARRDEAATIDGPSVSFDGAVLPAPLDGAQERPLLSLDDAGIDSSNNSAPLDTATVVDLSDAPPTDIADAPIQGWADMRPDEGSRDSAAPEAGPGLPQGAACSQGSQCALGFCSDGVCCDSICSGACQSCALQSSPGICTVVKGAPVAEHGGCLGSGTCAGTCTGLAPGCTYPQKDTACAAPTCVGSTAVESSSCDGTGTCVPGPTTSCSPFSCGTNACQTTCVDNSQCVAGAACVQGACARCAANETACPGMCANLQTDAKHCGACDGDSAVCQAGQRCTAGKCLLADGQTCSSAGQCSSGMCTASFADADQDGYPTSTNHMMLCGVIRPTGFIPARSDGKWDCCDADATVSPAQTGYFATANVTCGIWDWNCSGSQEQEPLPAADLLVCTYDAESDSCVLAAATPNLACGDSFSVADSCNKITLPPPNPSLCAPATAHQAGPVRCH
jgi:hypothetical protein